MVFIDLEIALGVDHQIHHAVFADLFEHVVEEAQTGGNVATARAVEVHLDMDIGLLGGALHLGDALTCEKEFCDLLPRHTFVAQNQ